MALFLESATDAATEAAFESLTVQGVEPGDMTEEGEQDKELRVGGETRLIEEL